jgi:hypothetical protein
MPWIVGIDEAGYGPNLGPLVMTSVACRVPECLVGADLWTTLRRAVRRHDDEADDRVVVGDSKLIYSPGRGLPNLERSVLAILPRNEAETRTLAAFVDQLCPDHHAELRLEPWYTGTSTVPAAVTSDVIVAPAKRFHRTCGRRALVWGQIRSVVLCPSLCNTLMDRWGSKGALLGHGLAELLRHNRNPADDGEPVCFLIDKHGGRNTYAAMVQQALDGGMVLAHEEGMERSRYSVHGLDRPIEVTFEPRADTTHFCVALASMVSKYLRELLMREFNAFWRQHLPELKPTAGYPGDAARFFEAIRPVLQQLCIPEECIWRRK